MVALRTAMPIKPACRRQGQEKDKETGWEAFELRMYDGRVGRWMTTDPYSQYHSPYLAMENNPINRIDPDGGKAFWIPDENGHLIAEKGDNATSLAKTLGISVDEANNMINEQDLLYETLPKAVEGIGSGTLEKGQTLKLDNIFTRSLAKLGSLPNVEKVGGPIDFNCFSTCIGSARNDTEISMLNMNSDYDIPSVFDGTLKREYINVPLSSAIFGKTAIRFSSSSPYSKSEYDNHVKNGLVSRDPRAVGGALHGAVYYGTSRDGTVYVYTKNGYKNAPRIMKLSELKKQFPIYGNEIGLQGDTPFYNPK